MIPRYSILLFCFAVALLWIGYEAGYSKAAHKPKVCAEVPGLKPISSTADTCTYIQAQGLAYYRRKAI